MSANTLGPFLTSLRINLRGRCNVQYLTKNSKKSYLLSFDFRADSETQEHTPSLSGQYDTLCEQLGSYGLF